MKIVVCKRALLVSLTLALVALMLGACANKTTVVNHPRVELSPLLPALSGFSYDESYAARSEPAVPYFNYAYRIDRALELPEAEGEVRRELAAKGWDYVKQDLTAWEERHVWRSTWQRKVGEDRWDRLEVEFFSHQDRDPKKRFSQIVYRMNHA